MNKVIGIFEKLDDGIYVFVDDDGAGEFHFCFCYKYRKNFDRPDGQAALSECLLVCMHYTDVHEIIS